MAMIHQLEQRIFQYLNYPNCDYKTFEEINEELIPQNLIAAFGQGAHGMVLYLFYQKFELELSDTLDDFAMNRIYRAIYGSLHHRNLV